MKNEKVIQRAIAKTIVWDTNAVIKLLNKYEPVKKGISYNDLFIKLQNNIDNQAFADDFTKLMLKKKRLSDFNNVRNADGDEAGSFFSGFMTGGLSSVTSLTSTIVNSISRSKERELEEDKLDARNTAQIMSFMQSEDEERMAKEKQTNMIIMVAVGGMILITGIMIFKAK